MKIFQWALRAFVFVGLLQVIACTKTIDTTSTGSINLQTADNMTFPTSSEFSTCKLRRIYVNSPFSTGVTSGLFTYNSQGNPYSVTFDDIGTGLLNHYFIYDNKGRLKEYRKRYSPDDPVEEERHVYGYDANNRIVTDSLQNTWGGVFMVSTLTYDSQGRIIKETIVWSGHPTRNPTYTYDARGNLGVAGWKSSSYDNKVSIFRAHPVFQFIHRNYSRNNAAPQAKYNSKGLPLSMNPANDVFFYQDPNSSVYASNISKVVYDCQ